MPREPTHYMARASCLKALSDCFEGGFAFGDSFDVDDRLLFSRVLRLDMVDVLRIEAVSVCFSSMTVFLCDVVLVGILVVGLAYGR